jgi:hypothetical protein
VVDQHALSFERPIDAWADLRHDADRLVTRRQRRRWRFFAWAAITMEVRPTDGSAHHADHGLTWSGHWFRLVDNDGLAIAQELDRAHVLRLLVLPLPSVVGGTIVAQSGVRRR